LLEGVARHDAEGGQRMTSVQTVFSSFAYKETLEIQVLLYARYRVTCEVRADDDGGWNLEFNADQQTATWADLDTVRGILQNELLEMRFITWHAEFSSQSDVRARRREA
jgi:hypothetical protein